MLQSNRARSLAVNLHSELGGDKEKYLALGKRDGQKKYIIFATVIIFLIELFLKSVN